VDHDAYLAGIAELGDGSLDRELLTMLSYPLVRGGTSPEKRLPL
jgi:hypothetical protein